MKGFTLIELMVVVIIITILAAIALPNYQNYTRKNDEKIAEQKMQEIALRLEKERSTNFSFKDFTLDQADTVIPKGKVGAEVKYNIGVNTKIFQKWIITACVNSSLKSADKYNNFSMNSNGAFCQWKEKKTCTVPDKCKVF